MTIPSTQKVPFSLAAFKQPLESSSNCAQFVNSSMTIDQLGMNQTRVFFSDVMTTLGRGAFPTIPIYASLKLTFPVAPIESLVPFIGAIGEICSMAYFILFEYESQSSYISRHQDTFYQFCQAEVQTHGSYDQFVKYYAVENQGD